VEVKEARIRGEMMVASIENSWSQAKDQYLEKGSKVVSNYPVFKDLDSAKEAKQLVPKKVSMC